VKRGKQGSDKKGKGERGKMARAPLIEISGYATASGLRHFSRLTS